MTTWWQVFFPIHTVTISLEKFDFIKVTWHHRAGYHVDFYVDILSPETPTNIIEYNDEKMAEKAANRIAEFLGFEVISDKDGVSSGYYVRQEGKVEKTNNPEEICPNCEAKFTIENPESINCPDCETSLMMNGEGKLKIEN